MQFLYFFELFETTTYFHNDPTSYPVYFYEEQSEV